MTGALTSSDRGPALAVARFLVPVGLGVVTWVLALLAGGVLLSIDSVSVFSIVLLVGLGVLFVPVYRLRPWEPELTERVFQSVHQRRRELVAAIGLFVLVRLPVISDLLEPLLALLLFPLRVVPQLLFGVTVFYGARIGDQAGQLLFEAGRLYAEFLWLYVVGAGIVMLVPRGGERP